MNFVNYFLERDICLKNNCLLMILFPNKRSQYATHDAQIQTFKKM